MSEEFPVHDLKKIEAALAALAPAPAVLDRDRLMFQAGQTAGLKPAARWGWPAAAAVLAAVAAALALVMVIRPPVVTERVVVYVEVEKAPPPAPERHETETPEEHPAVASRPTPAEAEGLAALGSFRLQEQLLRWGLDALAGTPRAAPTEPALTVERLLEEPPRRPQPSPWWNLNKLIPIGGQS